MKKSEHTTQSATEVELENPAIPSGNFCVPELVGELQFNPERMVEYLGPVSYGTNDRVLNTIKQMLVHSPHEQIVMTVTSSGGPSGTAMSFYDMIQSVLKPNLTTIGSGDVDSSGIIVFLSGTTRYVTKHTTLLFHLAGRVFRNDQRFTVNEIGAMIAEDTKKDDFYAEIVAERSDNKLTKKKVLGFMKKNTVMSPKDLVRYGLADGILG
jgi:ATP-dependent protease ClpP protease subunit